jgi:prephenate dehydrogenase
MSEDGFTKAPTVVIWGVGLIGGSLGMAWRRAGAARRVIGTGGSRSLGLALELGAIDEAIPDPAAAIARADVLVLAAPVSAILEQAATHAKHVRPGTIVTDVGSTKAEIVAAWDAALPAGAAFLGGHPMFGREVSGVANATPDLPRGCRWVLTPGGRTTAGALDAMRALARAAGATPLLMPAAEHDRRVAVASHLPQLAATALAATAETAEQRLGGVLALAASGFRDTTRLAGSPAELWADILLTNRAPVLEALAGYRQTLGALEAAIAKGDAAAIAAVFAEAHAARSRL